MVKISWALFKHIRKIEIITKSLADDLMIGAYHSAFKGRGMEFEEVREYIPGDDVRSIDWNVTARMNHPYTKSFREERELTVMLLVDISGSTEFGSGNQTKRDLMTEIAALLAYTAIKNHDHVGLLLFSDHVEHYLAPKKGVKHILRLIRDLVVFKGHSRQSDLKPALDYLGLVHKKRCVCFLISDFIFPLTFNELALTAKKHDLISFFIQELSEESFPALGLAHLSDLETSQKAIVDFSDKRVWEQVKQRLELRKATLKKAMQKIGGSYLILETNRPYEGSLKRFFHLRRKK